MRGAGPAASHRTEKPAPRPRRARRGTSASPGNLRTVSLDALVRDGDEQPFRDLVSDLFATSSTMQSLRRATAKAFGISATELAVLVAVAKLRPDPSINRIAEHLHVAAPNVTADVGKLVRAGLLDKRVDRRDARVLQVSLSAAGETLYGAIVPELRAVNDRLFAGLTREDVDVVAKLMRQIAVNGDRIILDRANTS